MSDAPLIILITFALFIQIEASSFEAKMSEELGQCSENMAVIFQDSTDLLAKYKALKKETTMKYFVDYMLLRQFNMIDLFLSILISRVIIDFLKG